MPRPPVLTRLATASDVPTLVALAAELRLVGARSERAVNPVGLADIGPRLFDVIESPDCRVVLACIGDEPAGMAVFRAVRPDPLSESRLLQVSHVVVAPGLRRRGVGHALLAAAADQADELGVEHVIVGLYASLREASRFYARLGFAPMVVQRVAPVALLRRRLGQEPLAARVDDVVRRRTRVRRPLPRQRAVARAASRLPD